MGFRLRKSFKCGPLRATISRSGISTSIGIKGARVTKKANGNITATIGIPNSGISYTETIFNNSKNSELYSQIKQSNNELAIMRQPASELFKNMPIMLEARQYTEFSDPQTINAPIKPKFGNSLFYFFISLIIGLSIFLFAGFIITPGVSLVLGIVIAMIFYSSKRSKWKEKYRKLRKPISYEDWQKNTHLPNMFSYVANDLTVGQMVAYIDIVDFCKGNFQMYFTKSQLNFNRQVPISDYMIDKLYNLGFLNKPIKGHYCLNTSKIDFMLNNIKQLTELSKNKYDTFVQNCDNWNIASCYYNADLIKKRNKDGIFTQ